ncbi:MAG: hypothetical protein AB7K52_12260 [Phycisphaerales bacterium]
MPDRPLVTPPIERTPAHAGGRVHVAIVMPRYVDLMLRGGKTVESRLSRSRRAPFEQIAPGELILFRERGGGYRAQARVAWVRFEEALTPADVRRLEQELEPRVRAGSAYWRARRTARFATLIGLERVRAAFEGPEWIAHGAAWRTFEDLSARRPAAERVRPAGARA